MRSIGGAKRTKLVLQSGALSAPSSHLFTFYKAELCTHLLTKLRFVRISLVCTSDAPSAQRTQPHQQSFVAIIIDCVL